MLKGGLLLWSSARSWKLAQPTNIRLAEILPGSRLEITQALQHRANMVTA
jgi:hypothetical protein